MVMTCMMETGYSTQHAIDPRHAVATYHGMVWNDVVCHAYGSVWYDGTGTTKTFKGGREGGKHEREKGRQGRRGSDAGH